MGTILGRPAQGRSPYFADFARALGMDGTTFKDKVSRNNSFKAKMLELNMVEYIKPGWKYTHPHQPRLGTCTNRVDALSHFSAFVAIARCSILEAMELPAT